MSKLYKYEELTPQAKEVVHAECRFYLESEFHYDKEIMANIEEHIQSEARQALYDERGVFQQLR